MRRFVALLTVVLALAALMAMPAPGLPAAQAGSGGAPPEQTAQSPTPRRDVLIAYDSLRRQLVLLGGTTCSSSPSGSARCVDLSDTWAWDGTIWTQQHPPMSPPPRTGGSMVYDEATRTVVLFGGYSGTSRVRLDDTWTWDGSTWTRQHPAGKPPARENAAMAYDAARGVVVLFGGVGQEGCDTDCLADTWTWDGADWTLHHPQSGPGARHSSLMADDAARGTVVLFGGTSCAGEDSPCIDNTDTWLWDGGNWGQAHPAASPPSADVPPASYHTATYGIAFDATAETVDVVRRVSLTPGLPEGYMDVWAWDGVTWAELPPSDNGPQGALASLASDTTAGDIVVLGEDGDLWTSSAGVWAQRTAALTPPSDFAGMAFDPALGAPVLLGIDGVLWSWNGKAWRQQFTLPRGPQLCRSSYLGYDAARHVLLAFGNAGCGTNDDRSETWTWDGTSWAHQMPSVSPPPRMGASVAYDTAHAELVLFGGATLDFPNRVLGDTWTWDGSVWTQRTPAVSPPAREGAAMASDDATGAVILFGGTGNFDLSGPTGASSPTCSPCYRDDTWTWDGSTWVELHPAGTPSARAGAALVYDPAVQSLLLFSGVSSIGYNIGFGQETKSGDTWSWDGNNWTELHPATSPPARSEAAIAYDPVHSLVLLYRGEEAGSGDVWSWDGTTWSDATSAAGG